MELGWNIWASMAQCIIGIPTQYPFELHPFWMILYLSIYELNLKLKFDAFSLGGGWACRIFDCHAEGQRLCPFTKQ